MPIEFSQAAPSVNNVAALQTPTANAEQNTVQTEPQISPTAAQEAAQSAGQEAQANVVNASAPTADNQITGEQVSEAISDIQAFVESNQRALNFSVDEGTRRSVVSVTDANSGDIIRQIPSEEVLELAERIRELQTDFGSAVGVFFNREV